MWYGTSMCAVEQVWILWKISCIMGQVGALWAIWCVQVIFVGFDRDGVIQSCVLKKSMPCRLFLGHCT